MDHAIPGEAMGYNVSKGLFTTIFGMDPRVPRTCDQSWPGLVFEIYCIDWNLPVVN